MKLTHALLLALAAFVSGLVAGRDPSRRADAPGDKPTVPPGVLWTGDVTVRTAHGDARVYVPHSVHVDNVPTFVDAAPVAGPVTVLTLDGGRVKIAATEAPAVTPR